MTVSVELIDVRRDEIPGENNPRRVDVVHHGRPSVFQRHRGNFSYNGTHVTQLFMSGRLAQMPIFSEFQFSGIFHFGPPHIIQIFLRIGRNCAHLAYYDWKWAVLSTAHRFLVGRWTFRCPRRLNFGLLEF